jgi:hypothetical protein
MMMGVTLESPGTRTDRIDGCAGRVAMKWRLTV